ncbi:hypothetical protein MSB04_01355 [bacterium]|nr:hypothetical protein [bacterium]
MSFIPIRNRKRNPEWFGDLKKGFNQFLVKGDWLYNFENENPQPKKQDIEARYLSQYFFLKLIQSIDARYEVEITDSTYMYLVCNGKKTMFHFDVMNNPKESHGFGKSIKKVSIEEWEKWKNGLYHTIGNLTPVPWPVMKYGTINMQDIHKDLDERWDLFLKFCQSEWQCLKKYNIHIDFQLYIKFTCQEIYFVEIYDLFNKKFGKQNIEGLSNDGLLAWHDEISTIDLSKKEIVSFGNDLLNDVRNINRLIVIRGRVMMALVLKNRQ